MSRKSARVGGMSLKRAFPAAAAREFDRFGRFACRMLIESRCAGTIIRHSPAPRHGRPTAAENLSTIDEGGGRRKTAPARSMNATTSPRPICSPRTMRESCGPLRSAARLLFSRSSAADLFESHRWDVAPSAKRDAGPAPSCRSPMTRDGHRSKRRSRFSVSTIVSMSDTEIRDREHARAGYRRPSSERGGWRGVGARDPQSAAEFTDARARRRRPRARCRAEPSRQDRLMVQLQFGQE